MFDASKITEKLVGIVGLRQPYNPTFAILDAENTQSRSGLFVTDNTYAKIELLKDTQDYKGINDTQFNDLLKRMQKASIINVCSQVFNNESAYIDRNLLFKNASNKIETQTLPDGFVGYRIRIDSDKNLAFKITRALLDFEGTGEIKLLLFNTAKKDPLFEQEITITTDHQEVALNWTINNTDTTYKGDWYIGYLSEGITVRPYKRDYNDGNVMSNISFLCIDGGYVSGYNLETLFDVSSFGFDTLSNGLNFDITVYDDFTDLIIQNENLFARAIYLDFVINFLHSYATSIRSNANERLSDVIVSRALMEIEGTKGVDSPVQVQGLRPQFLREISQIKSEIEKIKRCYFGEEIQVITRE